MAKIKVNRVTNANVYMDGNSLLGRAEEAALPAIKQLMAEHKALGMAGKFEVPAGFDKMEAKFKWASVYPEVMKKCCHPRKAVQVQVRASVETWTGMGLTAEAPLVCYLTGTFKDFTPGTYKPHDNVENESVMSVTYAKLEIDGEEIFEIDVLENIFKVAGEDVLETFKSNIGG